MCFPPPPSSSFASISFALLLPRSLSSYFRVKHVKRGEREDERVASNPVLHRVPRTIKDGEPYKYYSRKIGFGSRLFWSLGFLREVQCHLSWGRYEYWSHSELLGKIANMLFYKYFILKWGVPYGRLRNGKKCPWLVCGVVAHVMRREISKVLWAAKNDGISNLLFPFVLAPT